MRAALLAFATLSSSCSLIFMETLPDDYGLATEPRCDTTKGWVALDVFFALGNLAGIAAPAETEGQRTAYVIGSLLGAGLYGYSAITGNSDANDCRSARQQWDSRPEPEPFVVPATAELAPQPESNFYCTSSPDDTSIAACARTAERCRDRQRVFADAGVDVGPCVHVTSAVCVTATRVADSKPVTWCTPTVLSCKRQRDDIAEKVDAYSNVTECEDAE